MLSKIHLSVCKGYGLGRERRRNGMQNILVAAKLYVVNFDLLTAKSHAPLMCIWANPLASCIAILLPR